MNPETIGMDLTEPLVENPARDQEISAEYGAAADRFVRRLSWQNHYSVRGFILTKMDSILIEKDDQKAAKKLGQEFKNWQIESLNDLRQTPTEVNIRLALQVESFSMEDVHNEAFKGYQEVLNMVTQRPTRLYARKTEETEDMWFRLLTIGRIAKAVENRNEA